MTNPKSTAERLTEIETRLAAIDTRLAALVSPGDITALGNRVGMLEQRATATEQTLATKIPGFEQVGARVTELSGAFLTANQRLTANEQAIEALTTAAPAPAEQRLAAIETSLSALSGTVSMLQATRGRSGLSGRLRSIEEKLDALLPPVPPGG